MIAAIIISALTCVCLILSILLKPEITIKKFRIPLYPFIAVIGAVAAIIFVPLSLSDCWHSITGGGSINPLKILTLFISVTAISIFLDEVGFFEFLACKVLKSAGQSRFKLFALLYVTVAVLTVFTSNDVIILTFTPFILYFCRNAEIKPMPFLIAEFAAANTWSMTLIIGNPTNVYLATAAGISFIDYLSVMAVPTLFAGIASFSVLLLIFYKQLKEPLELKGKIIPARIKDKPLCIVGLSLLGICTVGLAISGYIGIEMWIECATCAGILILSVLLICLIRKKKPVELARTLRRVPWQLIPFVIGMFIIVLALDYSGITKSIAQGLQYNQLWEYGATSYLASNLVNNIPMSVLYSSIITAGEASKAAVYATIIGSNLGALLTPVGALAGIMFSSITKKNGAKFSNLTFITYGSVVSVTSLAAALAGLMIFI